MVKPDAVPHQEEGFPLVLQANEEDRQGQLRQRLSRLGLEELPRSGHKGIHEGGLIPRRRTARHRELDQDDAHDPQPTRRPTARRLLDNKLHLPLHGVPTGHYSRPISPQEQESLCLREEKSNEGAAHWAA